MRVKIIKSFLSVALAGLLLSCVSPQLNFNTDNNDASTGSKVINEHVLISMDLLTAVKDGDDPAPVLAKLAGLNLEKLAASLNTKQKKLAFWVNVYNGLVQYELTTNPSLFDDRDSFYKVKRHTIAGIGMNYDDMEHGIMRNSRLKLSLGYVKNLFAAKWEKMLRNEEIDGRIHFALNCGAKDCPPIAIFNDVEFENQMNEINKRYLKKHTSLEGTTITTSPLFSWFRADFDGKKGVSKFLVNYDIVPPAKNYKLVFKSYDWTLDTGNYIEL